jgi:hypothetical protein
MGVRAFKAYSVAAGGTPQPLIGTTTSAATGPGGTDPNGDSAVVKIAVADSSMFLGGDWAIIGVAANSDEERVWVQSVPDSTHITVKGMAKTHVTSSYVRLSVMCQAVDVRTGLANSGGIYVGTEGLVKTGFVNVIVVLNQVSSPTEPNDWSAPTRVGSDGQDVGQLFCDGTTADTYLPSLTIL